MGARTVVHRGGAAGRCLLAMLPICRSDLEQPLVPPMPTWRSYQFVFTHAWYPCMWEMGANKR